MPYLHRMGFSRPIAARPPGGSAYSRKWRAFTAAEAEADGAASQLTLFASWRFGPTPQPGPAPAEQLTLPGFDPPPAAPPPPSPPPVAGRIMGPLEAQRIRGLHLIGVFVTPEEAALVRGRLAVGPVEAARAAALHVEPSDFEAAFRRLPRRRQPLRWRL